MSSRRDWGKVHTRTLVRRHGVERADEPVSIMAPLLTRRPPVRKLSKAEMRAEAKAALAEWRRKR